MHDQIVSVSEFVALINQTLDFAYPITNVEGEVSELRISKGRWVYFNLIDNNSSIRVFGTIYQIRNNIENGMRVVVKGSPRLHNKYGFSLNAISATPSGEGSIKRALELLKAQLNEEGLFNPERKRSIPEFPKKIGLITSSQAAAYGDFMKIINQRYSGLEIKLANVAVQGVEAPKQLVGAVNFFSSGADPVDVVVITRGGGSTEDLMAFNDELVVRAIASSRIPTIVGVGHERDESLAELAADVRATTPTNAAQIVVPDKKALVLSINNGFQSMYTSISADISTKFQTSDKLSMHLKNKLNASLNNITQKQKQITASMISIIERYSYKVDNLSDKLTALSPKRILESGYSIAINKGKLVKSSDQLKTGDTIMLKFFKGEAKAEVIDAE